MKTGTLLGLASFILISGFLTSCGGGSSGAPPVASIQISPARWDANHIGQREQFTATAYDANGHIIPDTHFTWTTSPANIAAVDDNGNAIAIAAGTAAVQATAGDQNSSSPISVKSEIPTHNAVWMYTLWFARSIGSPVVLDNGLLKVANNIYCLVATHFNSRNNPDRYDWRVCAAGTPSDIPGPTSPWPYSQVAKFQWSGDRVGILSDVYAGMGTLRVLDRNTEWVTLAIGNASDFQLERNWIGELINNGHLRVKDGTNAPWHDEIAGGVQQFQLRDGYIGALTDDGTFRVKEGLDGPWVTLANPGDGVIRFQLATFVDSASTKHVIIGEQFATGQLRVKDGINGLWHNERSSGVKQFQLSGDYIAALSGDGTFEVKQDLDGTWATLAAAGSGLKKFQLETMPDANNVTFVRIGALFNDGHFQVKDGINGSWTVLAAAGARDFQLQEHVIGFINATDQLKIKYDINGNWQVTGGSYSQLSQFRLLANVPMAPARTRPHEDPDEDEQSELVQAYNEDNEGLMFEYSEDQRQCNMDNNLGHHCYPEPVLGQNIVPLYGRFCGSNIPSDADLIWARAVGRIDSLDQVCFHHDHGAGWYPEATGYRSCIVQYGIANAKLTNNGYSVSDITQQSNGGWQAMPNLWTAIYGKDMYNDYTSGTRCSLTKLADFTSNTAAQHNLDPTLPR